jgi:glycosyltransferase involved in cell wall biosynthesis
MCKLQSDIEWIVAAHPKSVPPMPLHSSVSWLPLADGESSALDFLKWYELSLPKLVKKYHPDVVFSQTNYLPRRPLSCGTLLLIQNAGHFSAEFDRLALESLGSPLARLFWRQKGRWIRKSVESATIVTVQTRALAEAIAAQTEKPRNEVVVIPHGPGIAHHRCLPRPSRPIKTFRIGYITKWGVQKNFQTLLNAARILKHQGFGFRVVLTLEKGCPETENIIDSARELGLETLIENHGEVPLDEIPAIYDSLDIFVFPSWCESFGFPTAEAMARGLPIVAAKTSENMEVTQGAALVFEPLDAEALARHMATLMEDDRERARRSEYSLARSRSLSWERAARETIAVLRQAIK